MRKWTMKLWVRHPKRMFDLYFGFCPVCSSTPPKLNCYVCRGSHEYGKELDPEKQAEWLVRFRIWLALRKAPQ